MSTLEIAPGQDLASAVSQASEGATLQLAPGHYLIAETLEPKASIVIAGPEGGGAEP